MSSIADIKGVGLGLKRELIPQIQRLFDDADIPDPVIANINFVEIAPENWIGAGGKAEADLAWFAERYPIACHGQSPMKYRSGRERFCAARRHRSHPVAAPP